jgi:hypothetical protein
MYALGTDSDKTHGAFSAQKQKTAKQNLMKLLMLVAIQMKLVALTIVIFATADASMEERVRALEEGMEKMSAKNAALEADNAVMKASTAGELKIFVDGRTVCPEGTAEPNITQGMMLVGRPKNGKTGAVFNRPFDAGEIGRTAAHSHAVSVHDPGHNHVNIVNDPGHSHDYIEDTPGGAVGNINGGNAGGSHQNTNNSKTHIVVDTLPAKSSIEVSIDANDAGEHYPLVYVLICQKLP